MRSGSAPLQRPTREDTIVTVLTFVDHFLPGFKGGGTARNVLYTAQRLRGSGVELAVVTADRDLGDTAAYENVPSAQWVEIEGVRCLYLPPRQMWPWSLRRIIRRTPHDVLYLNSLFSPRLTLQPLALRWLRLLPKRPVVVAPHGMLSPGALAIHRRRKRAFLRIANAAGLYRGVVWQATSPTESEEVRARFGSHVPVHIAPAPAVAGPAAPAPAQRDRLRVVFLSRISPKKNLDGALRVMAKVTASAELAVFGPVGDERYWADCRALQARLPPNVTMTYEGSVRPEQVAGVLQDADLFVLLTRGENFGHAVVEALLAGCPVLLSDRTPWTDLTEAGAGWTVPPDDTAAAAAIIDAYAGTSAADRQRVRDSARLYGERIAGANDVEATDDIAAALRNVFLPR